jgi:hypothetical protein
MLFRPLENHPPLFGLVIDLLVVGLEFGAEVMEEVSEGSF